MTTRKSTKYIHEGRYVAEVDIELIDTDYGWSPCLSLEDALKLDEVHDALRKNDLTRAGNYGRIYELKPVAV